MKVISTVGVREGEQYDDGVVLDLTAKFGETVFRNCTFTGQGIINGSYALRVPSSRRPRALFERCTFRFADKTALAQWCRFRSCVFEQAEDGLFDAGEMRLAVEGCIFRDMQRSSTTFHPDGVQTAGGKDCRHLLVRDCEFDMDGANSWVFIEDRFGPVSNVRVIGNRGATSGGPTYDVWLWDDGNGGPRHCRVDYNLWDAHRQRVPVAYNYAGAAEMIGPNNRYVVNLQ